MVKRIFQHLKCEVISYIAIAITTKYYPQSKLSLLVLIHSLPTHGYER